MNTINHSENTIRKSDHAIMLDWLQSSLNKWREKLTLNVLLLQLLLLPLISSGCFTHKTYREEGYKNVNGVNVFFRIKGKGEPVIILHGGPGMYHDELYPYFDELAKSHQVIFYDQRGNGKSALEKIDSTTFTEELLVEELEGLREAFGIQKLNIIGHSWGGLLAMYYAVKYPENVKRLVLVDAAPVNTDLLIKSHQNQISRFSPEELEHLQNLWESKEYLEGNPDVHNDAMRLSEGKVFSKKSVIDDYMGVASFNKQTAKNAVKINPLATNMKLNIHVQDQLSSINCPTLIIQGDDDFIVREAPQLARRLIQQSELVFIKGAGHYPHIEQPKTFNQELEMFLNKPVKPLSHKRLQGIGK